MSKLKRRMRLGLSLGGTGFKRLTRWVKVSEETRLDFILLGGSAAVADRSHPGMARKPEQGHITLEPLTVAAALAPLTRHIGLVATASTSLNHPFALARRLASIDHLSLGRAGWNLVTTATPDENRNHSLAGGLDSTSRYERAREFLAIVQGLFDGWEPGAFLRDRTTGVYMDPAKMHRLNHAGQLFKVRGPSDVDRPPQGALPIISAGDSEGDREFAAEVADMVFGGERNIEAARAHYSSMKAHRAGHGRTPESLHVLPSITPVIGRTQTEAEDLFASLQDQLRADDDGPMSDAVSCGSVPIGIAGTATQIADTMEDWFTTGAADGFVVHLPYPAGGVEDFARAVIPELQRRGLARTEYESVTLRGNLGMTPVAAWRDPSVRNAEYPAI